MATWKKIIVSGSSAHLLDVTASNLTEDRILIAGPQGAIESTDLVYSGSLFKFGNATVSGSIFSGSQFSGSFFGDGSGLTGITAEWDGTHEGDASITGSFTVSGSTGTVVDFTGVDAISGSIFSGSFVGDGSGLTGIAATLSVSGSVGTGSVDLKTESLSILGTDNQITTTASGSVITVGLADNVEISGSLIVTGSITGSNAKFDYIHVSGAVVNDLTASYAMSAETTALNSGTTLEVTPATASWILRHGLNTKYPIVTVWDSATDRIIEPNEVTSIDYQTIKIDFTVPIAGHVNISRAGHVVSGSVLWENLIAGPSGSQVFITDNVLGVTGSLEVTNGVSGSFSGSFFGDGSGLTGIAATLSVSGSIGTGSVDLKTESLTITGSLNGIITEVSGSEVLIKLDDHVIVNQLTAATASLSGSFSGSFQGDGSKLTGLVSTLGLSGSVGSGSVDMQTESLTILGTANEIETEVSGSTVTIGLPDNVQISGELIVTGSITGSNAKFDYLFVTGAVVAIGGFSGSFSGSFEGDGSGLTGVVSASYAETSSYSLGVDFENIQNVPEGLISSSAQLANTTIPGDLTIEGTLTSRTFESQLISSSIIYESGSTKFGDTSDDVHQFTGSIKVSGSVSGSFSGSFQGDGSGLTGIATTLIFSGSEGFGEVDLKTESLLITGSANGIVTSGSGQSIYIRLDDHVIVNQLSATTASLSGSFSGSFFGDGSALTGIAGALSFSGSEGNGEVDLQTQALNITGSANGIVTSGSGVDLFINLADHVIVNQLTASTASLTGSFTGSFVGDGSLLTGLTTTLNFSGSEGTGTVDLKTGSLNITGSVNGITTSGSGTDLFINLADHVIVNQLTAATASLTGSFTGSFFGDGSGLTGIAATLNFSGSEGTGTVDLKTESLNITGSINGITTSGSGVDLFINLADHVIIKQLTAETASLTGSFSGSFFGDGTGLTGVTAEWDGSHLGDASITGSFAVSGSGVIVDFTGADAISGSVFSGSFVGDGSGLTGIAATLTFSGSQGVGAVDLKTESLNITGSANGIVTSGSGVDLFVTLDDHVIVNQLTAATASLTGSFTGSFFGDGSGLTGLAGNLSVSASNGGSGSIDLKLGGLIVSGSANEVEVFFSGSTLTIGLPNNVTITDTLTVEGDLIVNGNTTVINTTEVLVEDKFIILASGSTSPTDGGIIVQSSGSAEGFGLGIDASTERWALQKGMASPTLTITPDAYVTATQFGAEAAQPQYPAYGATGSAFGNIWVSTDTGDIYIWA